MQPYRTSMSFIQWCEDNEAVVPEMLDADFVTFTNKSMLHMLYLFGDYVSGWTQLQQSHT